jgi:hypothetical protein
MSEGSHRFPAPWRADRVPGGYVVRDANGQALAYLYPRDDPTEALQAKMLTKDEARRIAANIARLPVGEGRARLINASPRNIVAGCFAEDVFDPWDFSGAVHLRKIKPIFYSSSGVTRDKSLILLVVRCHFGESVVPHFSMILVVFSERIATLCAYQHAEPACTSAARPAGRAYLQIVESRRDADQVRQ